jgi:hypothetical protein
MDDDQRDRELAFELVRRLALEGFALPGTLLTFLDHDPDWLWRHASALARANPDWVELLVASTLHAPVELRRKVVRDIAQAAPRQAREAVARSFPEPERSELLVIIRTIS